MKQLTFKQFLIEGAPGSSRFGPSRRRRMKTGDFNSRMVGKRVRTLSGEEGEVVGASREPTFSQMVPYVIEYRVKLDNGETVYLRRNRVRVIKQ